MQVTLSSRRLRCEPSRLWRCLEQSVFIEATPIMDCGKEAEFTRIQKAFHKDAFNKATYFNLQSAPTAPKCVFSVVPSRWKLKRLFLSIEIAKALAAFIIFIIFNTFLMMRTFCQCHCSQINLDWVIDIYFYLLVWVCSGRLLPSLYISLF